MSGRTPGPWVYNGEAIYADRASYERIAEPCFIVSPSGSRDNEIEFNAQLMATAPELYEALAEVVNCLSRPPNDRGYHTIDLTKARAALHKAKSPD